MSLAARATAAAAAAAALMTASLPMKPHLLPAAILRFTEIIPLSRCRRSMRRRGHEGARGHLALGGEPGGQQHTSREREREREGGERALQDLRTISFLCSSRDEQLTVSLVQEVAV